VSTLHEHEHEHGHEHGHGHGHEHGHDHDDLWPDDPDHPLWERDQIVLNSVGIDVGSATSQLLFSRLTLRRMGRELSSAFAVVGKEILLESPVWLTPYAEGLTIDEERLRLLVDDAFHYADLKPDDIDTGAIILTGEAARRHNAQAIAELFAEYAGKFVCATAGHHLEARLAAYGSGAVGLSERGARILNVDIGGGTTKLTVVDEGALTWTGALHVGGRLVQFDDDCVVRRLEPAAERLAAHVGGRLAVGEVAPPDVLDRMAEAMADAVVAAVSGHGLPPGLEWLRLTGPVPELGEFDAVVYSGGVSEYILGQESAEHGDLGPRLGAAFAALENSLPGPVQRTSRGIRATVLGASQFTVQISGNTIDVTEPDLLPMRNLRVVVPALELAEEVDADEVRDRIRDHVASADLVPGEEVAFGFRWSGVPSFDRLDAFVRGIRAGVAGRVLSGEPLVLLFQGDIARSVGGLLREQGYDGPLIVVDGIAVNDFDFVDLGAVLPKSGVVPVTMKSLVFSL
jgi:ethanolamine utilization protein EutA